MILELLLAFIMHHVAPLPPIEYREPPKEEVKILFTSPLMVHLRCGGNLMGKGQIIACAGVNNNWVLMPDPCLYTDDNYARVLCHELGHVNGWPADHPNPQDN